MSGYPLPLNPFPGFFAVARTGIFWDIDQFKIDAQSNAYSTAQNIRRTLSVAGHLGKVEIMAYGVDDGHDFKEEAKFTSFPAGADTDRHTKMLEDIRVWSSNSPSPSNLFLIMGDSAVDFKPVIESLESCSSSRFVGVLSVFDVSRRFVRMTHFSFLYLSVIINPQ